MELQVKMPYPRPCMVRQDGRALLHGLFVRAWTHGGSIPMALVEYEDGRLDAVAIDAVRMLDSAELFGECKREGGQRG